MGVGEPALRQRPAERVGQVLETHEQVADLRIHAEELVPLGQQPPVLLRLELCLDLVAQQHALGRQAVEDPAARLIGLGLESDTHAGSGVHGFGEAVREALPHRHHVDAERVLVAVDARPDHGEVGVDLLGQLERALRPVDRHPARVLERARQGAELELAVVEEQRDHRDQPDAGVGGEALPHVDVVFIDLVRVMRFEPGEAVGLETCSDLEPLLEVEVGLVLAVEAAVGGREEPDAGREFEIELEGTEMAHEIVGRPAGGLLSQVGDRHVSTPIRKKSSFEK